MEVPAQLARVGIRVLAISDTKALGAMRRRYANHGGAVTLVAAENLIEGLIQFGAQPPAVVIIDLDEPKCDVLPVFRQIRHTHAGIKAIALTSDKAKGKAALKAGADAYLSKPLDLKALDALILPTAVVA
jgi:DNA-binding response OmpR family regulator